MNFLKDVVLRYSLSIILGIFFKIFYLIFSPLTIWLTYFSIKLFVPSATLSQYKIYTPFSTLTFIDACIAASAYLLLSILILTTKGIRFRQRLFYFVIGSILILSFNIVRINILVYFLYVSKTNLYETFHMIFWKFLSTIFVFLTWVFLITKFNIIHIPIFSDFKALKKEFYDS